MKTYKILGVLLFCLSICFFQTKITFAEDISAPASLQEAEPNNNLTTATQIQLNQRYTGKISSDSDLDFFKFDVTETGYFHLSLTHLNTEIDQNGGWNITLYDTEFNEIYSYTNLISLHSATDDISFAPGTYYFKISAYNSYFHAHDTYQIQASFVADRFYEIEYNDSIKTASSIDLNSAYMARIHNASDVDYYQFTTTKNGYFNLHFSHLNTDIDGNGGWNITLFNEQGETLKSYTNVRDLTYKTMNFGIAKGTYYIKIMPYNTYFYTSSQYSIKINYKASTTFEAENNNKKKHANTLSIKKKNKKYKGTISGVISNWNDIDYYKVKITKKGKVTILFQDADLDLNHFKISVYNKNGKQLTSYSNTKAKKSKKLSLKKGTYYIRVEGFQNSSQYYYKYSSSQYNLQVSY